MWLKPFFRLFATWACSSARLERSAHNGSVAGSNPAGPTTCKYTYHHGYYYMNGITLNGVGCAVFGKGKILCARKRIAVLILEHPIQYRNTFART